MTHSPELTGVPVAATPPPNPFRTATTIPRAPDEPFISFPLSDDNSIEIRLKRRVSRKDFDRLKKLIELSEDSLVQAEQPDQEV